MSGDVRSDSILLAKHGLISSLRVFWSELALDVVVHSWSAWRCILHVDGWDCFAEGLLPSLVHLLGGDGELSLWWSVSA